MNDVLPAPQEKRKYVQMMFTRIAARYDLVNKVITFGQDKVWRKKAVRILKPENAKRYLDLGAGTGDLSLEIRHSAVEAQIIAVDLTMQMVKYGQGKTRSQKVIWLIADAQALPFPDRIFTGIISGYLLRNVPDIDKTLAEQFRILIPQGKFVALDTTPPVRNVLYPFIDLYLKWVIPWVGKIFSGDSNAYAYLPESTRKHLSAERLAGKIISAGFKSVGFNKMMFGTMAIHFAQKP